MINCFLGVDIGGTSIKSAIVNEKGKILLENNVSTDANNGPAHVKKRIKECISEIMKKAGKHKIMAAGIGSAGLVDDKGNIRQPPNFPGWKSENIGKLVKNITHLPAWVENDANAAALGEAIFGAGKNFSDFILLTLGTGVGGGIFINNELYRGKNFTAGEVGHIIVFPEGKKCNCGSLGCLERYVGIAGIKERAIEKLASANNRSILKNMINNDYTLLSPKIIYQAAKEGDKLAVSVLEETGVILGYAASTLITILNLQAIILAGGVSQAGNFIIKPMKEAIKKNTMPLIQKGFSLITASLGKDAGVIGAAAIALYNYKKQKK